MRYIGGGIFLQRPQPRQLATSQSSDLRSDGLSEVAALSITAKRWVRHSDLGSPWRPSRRVGAGSDNGAGPKTLSTHISASTQRGGTLTFDCYGHNCGAKYQRNRSRFASRFALRHRWASSALISSSFSPSISLSMVAQNRRRNLGGAAAMNAMVAATDMAAVTRSPLGCVGIAQASSPDLNSSLTKTVSGALGFRAHVRSAAG